MADKKISAMTALTSTDVVGTDVIPILDLSETDANKNKKITVDDLKKQGTVFTDLPGTAWDGTYRSKTLSSNTALTFSSTLKAGVLRITQDGTGSRTLSINGTAITINTAANSITYITALYNEVLSEYDYIVDLNVYSIAGGAGDVTAPTLVSATIEDADDTHIVLTFSETLDSGSVPAESDFSILKNAGTIAPDTVNVTGATVELGLLVAAIDTDVFEVTYTPGTNKIQDAAGNDAAAFSDEPVDNNVTGGGSLISSLLAGGSFHSYIDPAQDVSTTTSGSDELIDEIIDQANAGLTWKLVQVGAARPKLITGINGLPSVEVSGTTSIGNNTTWATPIAKPFHRIAVIEFKAVPVGVAKYAIYKKGGQQADFGFWTDGKGFAYSGATLFTSSTIVVDTPYVVCIEFVGDGATDKIYINGVLEATGNAGTNTPLNGIILGADVSGADAWIGDHIVTDGLLSSGDRDGVIAELMTKYGI